MTSADQNLLVRVSRRAMAGEFEVCFAPGSCADGTQFAIEALDLVEALEGQLSYFRPGSEISRINRLAAQEPIEIEPWLFDLLQLAMRVFEETDGAYDVTSAPLWEAWGFARRAGQVPSDAELAEALRRVGGRFVELDARRHTIRFLEPGVRINLGSIGKGYALDACAERLTALGMTDFLLHGGQSSILGRGGLVGPVGDAGERRPWEIGVANPRLPGKRLGVVRLRNRALGTSGGQFQSFRHRGRRWGHILDPRTGWPAEGVLLTTMVAPTATLADALSTAFHVMGPRLSSAYCDAHPGMGMVMVSPGKHEPLEVQIAGLDAADVTIDA